MHETIDETTTSTKGNAMRRGLLLAAGAALSIGAIVVGGIGVAQAMNGDRDAPVVLEEGPVVGEVTTPAPSTTDPASPDPSLAPTPTPGAPQSPAEQPPVEQSPAPEQVPAPSPIDVHLDDDDDDDDDGPDDDSDDDD